MFLSAPIKKTVEDMAHLRDWCKWETQVLLYWKKDITISEHLYHNLVQRRLEKGIKCGLICIVPFTIHLPITELYVSWCDCVCSVVSGSVGKLKSWKQFWLNPRTNKWAIFPNPRVWHSSPHRALCNTSLGSSTTGYCSMCILFLNYLKASVQCEYWQWAWQEWMW